MAGNRSRDCRSTVCRRDRTSASNALRFDAVRRAPGVTGRYRRTRYHCPTCVDRCRGADGLARTARRRHRRRSERLSEFRTDAMRHLCIVRRSIACIAFAAPPVGAQARPDSVGPTARYAAAARSLERFIDHEMADKMLPALSIALVDGQNVVWARGFGFANPADSTRATARTV